MAEKRITRTITLNPSTDDFLDFLRSKGWEKSMVLETCFMASIPRILIKEYKEYISSSEDGHPSILRNRVEKLIESM